MAAGMQPGQHPDSSAQANAGPPSPNGAGKGNQSKQGEDGTGKNVAGHSGYLGLPARDRQAIQQSQSEKYPEEFGPMIEQYLRNLAEQSRREH